MELDQVSNAVYSKNGQLVVLRYIALFQTTTGHRHSLKKKKEV